MSKEFSTYGGKIDILSTVSRSDSNDARVSEENTPPYSHGDTSDICPVCKKKMVTATIASGEAVNFCQEHRITMPQQIK